MTTPLTTDPAAKPIKETKAQKSERLKREKNPWDAIEEIRTFALKEGRQSVIPEWAEFYASSGGAFTPRATASALPAAPAVPARPLNSSCCGPASPTASPPPPRCAPSASSPSTTVAISPTSPPARPSSFTGSPSSPFPPQSKRSMKSAFAPRAPAGDVARNVTGCPPRRPRCPRAHRLTSALSRLLPAKSTATPSSTPPAQVQDHRHRLSFGPVLLPGDRRHCPHCREAW